MSARRFCNRNSFCTCSVLSVSTSKQSLVAAPKWAARPQVVARTSQQGFCTGNSFCTCGAPFASIAGLPTKLRRPARPQAVACPGQDVSATATAFARSAQLVATKQSFLWCASCLHCGAFILHTIVLCAAILQARVYLAGRRQATYTPVVCLVAPLQKIRYFAQQGNRQLHIARCSCAVALVVCFLFLLQFTLSSQQP